MKTLFKFSISAALLVQATVLVTGAQAAPLVQLRGIVSFTNSTLALLETTNSPLWERYLILAPGQRQEQVEVMAIDPAAGQVEVRIDQERLKLSLPASPPNAGKVSSTGRQAGAEQGTICLDNAGPDFVFRLYQGLAQRTLLRRQALPKFTLSLTSPGSVTVADALGAIEKALAETGIYLRQDRDKFAIVTADPKLVKLPASLWELAERLQKGLSQTSSASSEEVLPAGSINFPNTDIYQVLMIYQELAGRTLVRPMTLPAPTIALTTYTPISRTEATYAIQACFFLNGISFHPAFEKLLLVLPNTQSNQAAAMIQEAEKAVVPAADRVLAAGTVNLSRADLRQIAALYADLAGWKVEVAPDVPGISLQLKSQTTLAAREALQALNLLLVCNNLSVVPSPAGDGLSIIRRQARP